MKLKDFKMIYGYGDVVIIHAVDYQDAMSIALEIARESTEEVRVHSLVEIEFTYHVLEGYQWQSK